MKKIVAVVAFFAITLCSTSSVLAQNFDVKLAQEESKTFVKETIKDLDLTVEQEKAVYNASMLKIRMTASAKNDAAKVEINTNFNKKLKVALKPSQYKKYLALKK